MVRYEIRSRPEDWEKDCYAVDLIDAPTHKDAIVIFGDVVTNRWNISLLSQKIFFEIYHENKLIESSSITMSKGSRTSKNYV